MALQSIAKGRRPRRKVATANVDGGRMSDRDKVKCYVCGHCSTAALNPNPNAAHRRCHGPCACGALDHHWTAKLAEQMANVCHTEVEKIYEAHGRKRRTLTDEQREAAAERLAKARRVKQALAVPTDPYTGLEYA